MSFITVFSRNCNINDIENSSGAECLYVKVTEDGLSWEYMDLFITVSSFQ